MPNSYTRTLVDDGCYVIDSKAGWNFGEPQHLKESELQVSIADNGNAREPMQCVLQLRGKNEGELQIVSPGADEWKPWKIKRTAVN